jgi:hypothetical protein
MYRCKYELDPAACLGRRKTPTPEEARGAFLASRHPCDSCGIGSRRAREEAEKRAMERMQAPCATRSHPAEVSVRPSTRRIPSGPARPLHTA